VEHVAPGIWRATLGVPEDITPIALREIPVARQALERLPDVDAPPFDEDEIRFLRRPRGCTAFLPLERSERIFGLGLQLKSHDQTTLKKTLRTNSDPVADTGDSHAPVPFYLSTAGYGVFVDTARYASFYCGSHALADEPVPDESPGRLVDNAEALYHRDRRPRGPMVVDIPSAGGVDVYVLAGPTLRDALRRYVLFSGGGCLPPLWGLGVWYRGYIRHTQEQSLALAGELRASGMPCDVFGLEPGWQSHAYACSHAWHPQRFPRPDEYLSAMREMSYRVNLWEHLFTDVSSPLYEPLKDRAGSVRVWGGLVPDVLRGEARAAIADHHDRAFVSKGVSGFKLDECDNSDFIFYPWSFPEYTEFPSGADGEQMHALLGVQYQRLIHEVFRRHNLRTLGQVRSSHALAAPYPFVLYSDLYDHGDFIRGVVNAGLGGLLWSPEVRQCRSGEELIRRVQTVCFSPQALVNAWMIDHPPWKQVDKDLNNAGQLMEDWPALQDAVRELFRWRMRLLPYLYAGFHRYRLDGLPPFRPLVADWPDDQNVYDVDDEYMMGDDLLVAPVPAGAAERSVYLPDARWYHLFTHEPWEGGRRHDVPAPLEQIPVFVRSGTLLPLAEPVEHVDADTVFHLTVWAFGEVCRPATLLEDDGESLDVESGFFNELTLSWSPSEGGRVERRGEFPGRRYRVSAWRQVAG
jgi:alpha-D-xyloside xylohydrolase